MTPDDEKRIEEIEAKLKMATGESVWYPMIKKRVWLRNANPVVVPHADVLWLIAKVREQEKENSALVELNKVLFSSVRKAFSLTRADLPLKDCGAHEN